MGYLYQIVTDKARFIAQLLDDETPARVSEDCDDKVLTYGEMQAAAEGNPNFRKRIDESIYGRCVLRVVDWFVLWHFKIGFVAWRDEPAESELFILCTMFFLVGHEGVQQFFLGDVAGFLDLFTGFVQEETVVVDVVIYFA